MSFLVVTRDQHTIRFDLFGRAEWPHSGMEQRIVGMSFVPVLGIDLTEDKEYLQQ